MRQRRVSSATENYKDRCNVEAVIKSKKQLDDIKEVSLKLTDGEEPSDEQKVRIVLIEY